MPDRRLDAACAAALGIGAVAYVAALPRNLGPADEAYFLYAAKRLLEGDLFYRDIWEIITPGAQYAMAALFWLFGTTMATARLAAAVVHGAIVVLVFAAARQLGVRRSLAAIAAIGHLAVCHGAWPYSSPHWVTAALTVALLLVLLRRPWATRARGAFLPGLLVAVEITVEQHRGAVMALAVVTVLALDAALPREPTPAEPAAGRIAELLARIAWAGAGMALAAIPLAALLASSGVQPVLRALVWHPLINYRNTLYTPWGSTAFVPAFVPYTFPRLLAYAPVLVGLDVVRAADALRRRAPRDVVYALCCLVVFAACAIASIAYFPDFVHLAFIGPVFLVLAAEAAEWLMRLLAAWRPAAVLGVSLAAALLVAEVAHLRASFTRAWQTYPVPTRTEFGWVDEPDTRMGEVIARVRAVANEMGVRELFVYPVLASVYLMAGLRNPTPYQVFLPPYNDAEQVADLLAILDRKRVPLIVLVPLYGKDDPIVRYVHEHYEPVPEVEHLWRRRPEP